MKAGFAALSPSALANTILQIFEFYTIGPNFSDTYHKLFCFYYGDQIAILNALRDIKDSGLDAYQRYIGWIDVNLSIIATTQKNNRASIFMPKGDQEKCSKTKCMPQRVLDEKYSKIESI